MSQLDQVYRKKRDEFRSQSEVSEIANFMAGKTLFITGCTGYMGRIFVEKLVRCCPDIKHIYVLMRVKNNMTVEKLLHKYFQNVVFDLVRKLNPDFEKKVTAMAGELEQENLGLSSANRSTLINEVDLIFHNAANVKFDVRVSLGLRINVIGTKNMLDLAEECKHLQLFVYNSTAYSHCYRKDIYEELYESPATIDDVYELIRKDSATPTGFSKEFVKNLIGKFPNIYTYSKATAEGLVAQYAKTAKYKCVIYRPSVVLNVWKEPVVGWVGNHNGPILMFMAGALGLIHAFYNKNFPIDFIPCDMAINSMIAVSWDAITYRNEKGVAVYNYGSSTANPVTYMDLHNCAMRNKLLQTECSTKAIWMHFLISTDRLWLFWILHILFHFIPAVIADLILIITGKKPKAVSTFLFATRQLDTIDYFANGNWRIHVDKTLKVIDRMNSKDKEIFYFDIRPESFNWMDFPLIIWRGIKKYILKEADDLEASRRKYFQLFIMYYTFNILVTLLVVYLLSKLVL